MQYRNAIRVVSREWPCGGRAKDSLLYLSEMRIAAINGFEISPLSASDPVIGKQKAEMAPFSAYFLLEDSFCTHSKCPLMALTAALDSTASTLLGTVERNS